ncbi:MAG: heme-binding protein [Burkholderiaceae bacterium]
MTERKLTPVASSLTLAQANAITNATIAAAREQSLLPLAVVVLDAGGQMVCYQREDGCGTARFEIALGKASATLGMGVSGRTLRDRLGQRIGFQAAIAAATDGRFIAVPGGVLILDAAGTAIGAVGVSGDASDCDEYAAISGVRAAGLMPDPAEPSPEWQSAPL